MLLSLFFCLFFCLLFIGFTSAQVDLDGCGISIYQQPRIIGGKPAKLFAHPWMVFLQIDNRKPDGRLSNCGGAILNHRWIVTAAHCVNATRMETSKAYVDLQHLNERNDEYVQEVGIYKIVIHPYYWYNKDEYDIALIKTTKNIDIKGSEGHVNSICLPEFNSPYPTGHATVIGWGCLDYDTKEYPDVLHEVVLPIRPIKTCIEVYGNGIRNMICAGSPGKDSCQGDSGGPLFQTHNGVSYLIGIVSSGANGQPGLNTKVAPFLGWMRNVMRNT